MKDLLRSQDLLRSDVEMLLATASEFASAPLKAPDLLANKAVAIYMSKPSTRTRLASESAVAHLGGTPIFLRGDELQIGRGETIADTAKVISQFAQALIIRTFAQSDVDELGANASIPVINGLTDYDHPTQALADWLTIREVFGRDISGRKFTYLGDGNNVATAWLMMGAIMGAHVVAATPDGKFAPKKEVLDLASELALESGGRVEVTTDARSAVSGASVLYTDVWMSMGDIEADRIEKERALSSYQVNDELMSLASNDAIFMHCLPAHRGEEVSASVIDGPASKIWRQAFHRRSTIQAILYHSLRGELKGRL
ncbi:MAG: ornithine carbamoyltransferase [Actinobacteria bacterium]|nr:ornithine carbamoyltransferase [Actinomycetota bacterium]